MSYLHATAWMAFDAVLRGVAGEADHRVGTPHPLSLTSGASAHASQSQWINQPEPACIANEQASSTAFIMASDAAEAISSLGRCSEALHEQGTYAYAVSSKYSSS